MSIKRASLKDVALLAGVGLGTASRVINGSNNVKPSTKQRVETAIRELNYYPNNIARSLKINTTKSVGILLTDLKNGFDTEIVRGIEIIAEKEAYSLFLTNTNKEKTKMLRCIQHFVEKNVDGIIIIGGEITEDFYTDIREFDIPLITVSCEISVIPQGRYASISIDNEKAAYEAVEFLIKKGHTKIAMISGEKNEANAGIPRINGYKRALSAYHLPILKHYIAEGNYTFESGYYAAQVLLSSKELPTAIFAASDSMAIGAQKAILENGYSIPEKISIFGFDGMDFTAYVYPALSTVMQPRYEMGKLAMRTLLHLIKNIPISNSRIILPHQLVIRNSC